MKKNNKRKKKRKRVYSLALYLLSLSLFLSLTFQYDMSKRKVSLFVKCRDAVIFHLEFIENIQEKRRRIQIHMS